MSFVKCPRCEINYMQDTEEMCSVCRKEVRGEVETFDLIEMCSECGENPVVPGHELCAECLKEHSARHSDDGDEVTETVNAASIGIDSVSSMDEIELDFGNGEEDFSEDAQGEFDDEDDEDLDDEEN